jgi:hypothetical protein
MFLSEAEIKDDLKRITTDLADRAKQYYDAACECVCGCVEIVVDA